MNDVKKNTPTPHNEAKYEEIARTVLMPGDPLRAKFIAETYLDNARCVNRVRNMYAYTGEYKGKPVSVMGAGMGIFAVDMEAAALYLNAMEAGKHALCLLAI